MIFDFVHDKGFKLILERDYKELSLCLDINASKSVLILSGSIIEAVLSDYFIENLPQGKSEKEILKSDLGSLLDFAESEKLISLKEKQLGIIIKNYRNLIHPGREKRTKEEFDFETAKLSKILLDLILKKVRNSHFNKYGYSSEEILEKLKHDWDFHSIYGIIITKLDHTEREKLLGNLISIEQLYKSNFDHYTITTGFNPSPELQKLGNLEDLKEKVQELKPLIKQETIIDYLVELRESVINGESVRALTLYNLFHEELNQLNHDDQELIAIYMLSLFSSIFEESRTLAYDKTYSTIGKYIHTKKGEAKLKELGQFAVVHFGYDKEQLEHEMNVFEQVYNSLTTELQAVLQDDLSNFIPKDRSSLEKNKLHHFYDAAVKLNIMKEKYSS